MARLTLYPGKENSPAAELSSAIDDDDTTIGVTELSYFPDAPNEATIGNDDEESPETIRYTGKSGSSGAGNLTGVERGFQGTAQSWASGTKIRRAFTAYDYDSLRANQDTLFDEIPSHTMARQAIINGNFDIWQRGTSLASYTDATDVFLADRWYFYGDKNGGTPPTIAQSRQVQTPGALDNSFFYYRVTVDGAGSSYGNSMRYGLFQKIEHGTRYLCGNGKTITISFYARSSIANKRIGVFVSQRYGTGGSPSSEEVINGGNFSLTSNWQKFTITLETNTLSGKTFGSNYDDHLVLSFYFCWGSTYNGRVGASTAETWVGSGNIDIAQVQLCAGDVALPFEPRSYAEELAACQRYFYRIDKTDYSIFGWGQVLNSTVAYIFIPTPVMMRVKPTITKSADTTFILFSGGSSFNTVTITIVDYCFGFVEIKAAKSGYTPGDAAMLAAQHGTAAYLEFSAEL